MYFHVLKNFPTLIEFCNYARLSVTACTVVSSRGIKRIESARETEINWGAEPSRNLHGSSNSIFAGVPQGFSAACLSRWSWKGSKYLSNTKNIDLRCAGIGLYKTSGLLTRFSQTKTTVLTESNDETPEGPSGHHLPVVSWWAEGSLRRLSRV